MSSNPVIIICPTCATANRVPSDRLSGGGTCGRCKAPLFAAQPISLGSGNFDAHAARSGIPLLVDFWATWCGPCRQMAPAFAAAAGTLEPHVRLGKVDTEAEPELAARFGIRSIPTLVLIRGGREIARQSGAMPTGTIVNWTRQALGAG